MFRCTIQIPHELVRRRGVSRVSQTLECAVLRGERGLADGGLFGESGRNILAFQAAGGAGWLEGIHRPLRRSREIVICCVVSEGVGCGVGQHHLHVHWILWAC